MIGKLTIEDKLTAQLDDSGKWQSSDQELARYLNTFFNPTKGEYNSPSMGGFGCAAIVDAAKSLGAKYVVKTQSRETDEEVIY